MTPYQRRWIAAAAIAATITTTGAACAAEHDDQGAPTFARPSADAIAPGGNITSIQQETDRSGFPHRRTPNERADITNYTAALFLMPGEAAQVRCRFAGPGIHRPARCRVTTATRGAFTVRWGMPAAISAKTGRVLRPEINGFFEDGAGQLIATPENVPD